MVTIMEQSVRRLPNLAVAASTADRRHRVRQKLHTPVYATFNGPQTGMVVDLSDLVDLHEEGFAVQTSARMEPHRAVTICLDLPETRSFIHGTGEVMWSDETGRGGIRFSPLSETSAKILKQWLFANLLIGCANHAARSEQRARQGQETQETIDQAQEPAAPELASVHEFADPHPADLSSHRSAQIVSISDRSDQIAPLGFAPLENAHSEVQPTPGNADTLFQTIAFQTIAERALSLTGATGAALAYLSDDCMICRATVGQPAPPLGAPLDVGKGLSGECVRTGLLVSCEDTENDPRLDSEVVRALGIGSLMAAPIVSDFRVVGLLEIFSPYFHNFTSTHGRILERLAEMVPGVLADHEKMQASGAYDSLPEVVDFTHDFIAEVVPPARLESNRTERIALNISCAVQVDANVPGDEPIAPSAAAELIAATPLWRVEAVTPEQIVDPVVHPTNEPARERGTDPCPVPIVAIPSRLVYRALLGLTIAAVVVAIGYLLGPAIQKRWRSAPLISHSSFVKTAEAAFNAHSSDQNAQLKSLPELRRLAERGDPDAQWQMGVRYHNGEDVPQDDALAMTWFERAADQGQIDAQSHLGAYYWAGRGVPEDLYKAYFWSAIATAQGDEISKARLEGLASQMTRQQVSAARQEADTWIHTHSQRARSEAN